jgi:hypothetical protein
MIRAARLDVNLYEEVEADKTALPQALLVVIIANAAIGFGSALGILWDGGGLVFLWALLWGIIGAVIGWLIWSLIVYLIGITLFKGPETQSNYGELLRTIGFSASPGVIGILSFIPILGGIIALVVQVWMLVAMVIAVRQALDFTTWRAIGTCVVGWLVMMALIWGIGVVVGLDLF